MHRKGVPALAIKDQPRHTKIKTTLDFNIGVDSAYQKEQIEKLRLKCGWFIEGSPNGARDESKPWVFWHRY
jgi:hypothetical protein